MELIQQIVEFKISVKINYSTSVFATAKAAS